MGLGTEFLIKYVSNNENRKIVCYFAILKYYHKIGVLLFIYKKEKQ